MSPLQNLWLFWFYCWANYTLSSPNFSFFILFNLHKVLEVVLRITSKTGQVSETHGYCKAKCNCSLYSSLMLHFNSILIVALTAMKIVFMAPVDNPEKLGDCFCKDTLVLISLNVICKCFEQQNCLHTPTGEIFLFLNIATFLEGSNILFSKPSKHTVFNTERTHSRKCTRRLQHTAWCHAALLMQRNQEWHKPFVGKTGRWGGNGKLFSEFILVNIGSKAQKWQYGCECDMFVFKCFCREWTCAAGDFGLGPSPDPNISYYIILNYINTSTTLHLENFHLPWIVACLFN